jgi:hypothetical protein
MSPLAASETAPPGEGLGGQSLTLEGDAGGTSLGALLLRALSTRILNGAFTLGTPDDSQTVDDVNNALPYWSFVRTNTFDLVDAYRLGDARTASKYVIRLSLRGGGSAADEGYLAQQFPVPHAAEGTWHFAYRLRVTVATPASLSLAALVVRLQAIDVNGNLDDLGTTTAFTNTLAANSLLVLYTPWVQDVYANVLEAQVALARAAAANSVAQDIDVISVEVETAPTSLSLVTQDLGNAVLSLYAAGPQSYPTLHLPRAALDAAVMLAQTLADTSTGNLEPQLDAGGGATQYNAYRWNGAVDSSLIGFQTVSGGDDGRLVLIYNVSTTKTLTLVNESGLAIAGDRFTLPGAANMALGPGNGALVRYDGTNSRFYLIAASGSATSTAGPDADVTVDAAGAAGTVGTFARSQHGHKLTTTAGPGADVAIGAAGAAGATGTAARAGHGHRVDPTAGPDANVTVDAAGAAGTATQLARGGHGHQLVTAAVPGANIAVDAAGSAGTTGAVARDDHGHRVDTTAGPGADDTIDAAGAAGATGAIARAAHGHRVNTTAGPGAVATIDAAGAAGATGALARASHGHEVDTSGTAAVATAAAGAAGATGAIARNTHAHKHRYLGAQQTWADNDVIGSGALNTTKIYHLPIDEGSGAPGTSLTSFLLPFDGTVVGIIVRLVNARTGGTITFRAQNSAGTPIGPTAQIDATNTQDHFATVAIGSVGNTFVAGDRIEVQAKVTAATFAPITADVRVTLVVAFDLGA